MNEFFKRHMLNSDLEKEKVSAELETAMESPIFSHSK